MAMFKRMGTKKQMFQFGLEIHSIRFGIRLDNPEIKMGVEWTRGEARTVVLAEVLSTTRNDTKRGSVFEWEMKNSNFLMCTMYFTKAGTVQKKKSTLKVHQRYPGADQKAQTIGRLELDLAQCIDQSFALREFHREFRLTLPCVDPDAMIHFTVHSRHVPREEQEGSNSLGVLSSFSFASRRSTNRSRSKGRSKRGGSRRGSRRSSRASRSQAPTEAEEKEPSKSAPPEASGDQDLKTQLDHQKQTIVYLRNLNGKITKELAAVKRKQKTRDSDFDEVAMTKQAEEDMARIREIESELQSARLTNADLCEKLEEQSLTLIRLRNVEAESRVLRERQMKFDTMQGVRFKRGKEKEAIAQLTKRVSFYEEQLAEADQRIITTQESFMKVIEVQEEQVQTLSAELKNCQSSLKEAESRPTTSRGGSGGGAQSAYLELLEEFERVKEQKLQLSLQLTQLEVQYVQRKIDHTNEVNRVSDLEHENNQLKHQLRAAGISVT